MFPVMGSAVLVSLYLAFKYLDPFYLNILIKTYFSIFGVGALGMRVSELLECFAPTSATKPLIEKEFSITVPFYMVEDVSKQATSAGMC